MGAPSRMSVSAMVGIAVQQVFTRAKNVSYKDVNSCQLFSMGHEHKGTHESFGSKR